jgi:hypothetical protein
MCARVTGTLLMWSISWLNKAKPTFRRLVVVEVVLVPRGDRRVERREPSAYVVPTNNSGWAVFIRYPASRRPRSCTIPSAVRLPAAPSQIARTEPSSVLSFDLSGSES